MTIDEKYMHAALQQAREASANGDFPVGCVIEYDGEIVACGKRSNSFGPVNEMDHAEIGALRELLAADTQVAMDKVTVYCTMEPCLMCFSTLLVNGVRRFVYGYEDAMGVGTNLPLPLLSPLYRDLQVTIVGSVLRHESLELFKKFFSSPKCQYLKNTMLATYTLQQV